MVESLPAPHLHKQTGMMRSLHTSCRPGWVFFELHTQKQTTSRCHTTKNAETLQDGCAGLQDPHTSPVQIFYVLPAWKVKVLVAQWCPTLCDPIDCSLPGSSVHGIFQARILEWIAIPFSRGSSWPRDRIWVSCITGRFFTIWATWEWVSNDISNSSLLYY